MTSLQTRILKASQPGIGKLYQSELRSEINSIPSSVAGWNTKDALDNMDPRFALELVNYFPDGSRLKLRNGAEDHATGLPGPVEFVHTFAQGQQRKLQAFAGGNVYDVTAAGPVGAPLATGFASNRWFGANAGANGGETAIYVNGSDPAQQYNGTTWQASGITGPTKPTGVTVSKKRVWLIENGTGEAWYGPPEAVTGAFAKFDVGSVVPSGGELVAIGNITVDGAQAPDNLTVFLMKSGALVIYGGTDPSDPAAWGLQGVWQAGDPIGERCLVPFDKDLILITDMGFQSALQFTNQGGLSGVPISDNINPTISDAARVNGKLYGWHGIYHPMQRQLLFNTPIVENTLAYQPVMNAQYGAWCQFQGWNAICSALKDGVLFMGVQNKVIKASGAYSDFGNPILGRVQGAWNYFGIRGREKHYKQFRPNIRSNGVVNLAVGLGVNFNPASLPSPSPSSQPAAGQWDVDQWDTAQWAPDFLTVGEWRGAGKKGYNASISYATETAGVEVELLSTDIIFEVGAPV